MWPAEASYSLALAEGGAAVPDTEAAAIQSNRALVLLKAGHHMDAADAAAKATVQSLSFGFAVHAIGWVC